MSTSPLPPPLQTAPRNGYGVTAMVLGIVAVVSVFTGWLVPLALATGVLATVFGVLGRRRAARGEATDGGQALAGLILGPIGIGLAVLAITAFLTLGLSRFGDGDGFGGPDRDGWWRDGGPAQGEAGAAGPTA